MGGSGLDYLYGGSGKDILAGEDGNDYLAGGGGRDTFVFGLGYDKIGDFNPEVDRIDVTGSVAAALAVAAQRRAGVGFDFGNDDELKLLAVSLADLERDMLV